MSPPDRSQLTVSADESEAEEGTAGQWYYLIDLYPILVISGEISG
jgi:hypothetical protein